MNYGLPTSVELGGKEYAIRSDYRAILDILEAISDPELDDNDKIVCVLNIFYEEIPPYELWKEAIGECFRFIDLGAEEKTDRPAPKLMDWKQDFQYIVAPVNRIIGKEIRSLEYLHWWTFISAYYEIGECTFSQIVSIRSKKAKHKQLDKWEKEWYREHREMVDFKTNYTEAEDNILKQWGA